MSGHGISDFMGAGGFVNVFQRFLHRLLFGNQRQQVFSIRVAFYCCFV